MTFLFPVVLYFALGGYHGYERDASLYLLQTVNFIHPERFVGDPQFMFGNQGGFSLFNPLCAIFFKLFSINVGGIFFTLILQLNICLAISFFIKSYLPSFAKNKKKLAMAIGLAIILYSQSSYGCGDDFRMTVFEPFLVARLASQVLILWGLVFFYTNKNIALAFFLTAVAMHPLTGGWALLLWLLFYYKKCCVPIIILALLFPLTGFIHVGKFDFIYEDWLIRPLYMIPKLNDWFDNISILAIFVILGLKFKNDIYKRVSICLSVVAFIAIYWQMIAFFMEHVFLYQLQPFRFMWLSIVMLVPLVYMFFNERMNPGNFSDRGLLVTVLILSIQVISVHQSIIFPMLAMALYFIGKKFIQDRYYQHICCGLTLLIVIFITILEYASDFEICSFVYSALKYTTVLEITPYLKKLLFLLCVLLFLEKTFQRKWFLAALFLICSCFDCAEMLLVIALAMMYSKQISSFLFGFLQKKFVWTAAILLLSVYVFLCWDKRDDYRRDIEINMDRYLDKSIFDQVRDRGKIFFYVDDEKLIYSRFRFLTGGYVDNVIGIGEAFFYEQYKEVTRRKNLVAFGKESFDQIKPQVYDDKQFRVYRNLDSINNRLDLLCSKNEIKYIVTNQNEIVGSVLDSAYIQKGEKIFLKECRL